MRALILPCLVGVLLSALAPPAFAHSSLVSTEPPGGATLSTPPPQVVLRFDNPIEASFGGVQVFSPTAQRVESGEPAISGTEVTVPLIPLTEPGVYAVVFRVVSGDGHPVESRFTFAFQPPTEPGQTTRTAPTETGPTETESETPPPVDEPAPPPAGEPLAPEDIQLESAGGGTPAGLWVARLVDYMALTAVVGLLLAGLLLQRADADRPIGRVASRGAAVAALAWTLAALALFVFGLSTAAARALPQALDPDLAARFAGTRFGTGALAQAAAAVLVGVIAFARRDTLGRRVALAVAFVGAFATAWWGHAGSDDIAVVALASSWVHIVAVTSWVGGLGALALLLLPRRRGVDDVIGPAQRFSRLAAWSLAAVLVTGLVNAVLHIGAAEQLYDTSWGRLVLVKLALFGGIAALGWRNRTLSLPRLAEAGAASDARRRVRRFALVELGVMVLAFGTAASLASSVPADAEAAARVQSLVRAFGDGQINLTVDPAEAGPNLVHLYVLDERGLQREAGDPSLTFTLDGQTTQALLLSSGPGHYTVLAMPLREPGTYTAAVTATVDGERVETTGNVTVR